MAYQKEGVLKDDTRGKAAAHGKEDRDMLLQFLQVLDAQAFELPAH